MCKSLLALLAVVGAVVPRATSDSSAGPVAPEPVVGSASQHTASPSIAGPEAESFFSDQLTALPPTVDIQRHVIVGGTASRDSGTSELVDAGTGTLVYSNTLGQSVFGFASAVTMADDISRLGVSGCLLDRYELMVSGDRRGDGSGVGPFSVDFALYDMCPGAGGRPIPGTEGHADLPDEGSHLIIFQVPEGVDLPIPANLYLQVSFSRGETGVVVGAPALIGYSADFFDFPTSPCGAFLGGYPSDPHASFYAELYVRGDCREAFPGYNNSMQAGGYFTQGANIRFADDIELGVPSCDMTAYEVHVRGHGIIRFDLRTSLSDSDPDTGGLIPGTDKGFMAFGDAVQIARFEFDPPIPLQPSIWMTFKTTSSVTGPILTGHPAGLGRTEDSYAWYDEYNEWWSIRSLPTTRYAGFDITIWCEGVPQVGACCDIVNTDGAGEAVCRQIAEMNCPANRWIESEVCDPDPFLPACGLSACCTPDDTCEDLTRNECEALVAPHEQILWARGWFCSEPDFSCPFFACVQREGTCALPHDGVGCSDPFCCTHVCDFDAWCCRVEWDDLCVRWASECGDAPENDECVSALPIEVGSSTAVATGAASQNPTDPGLCCHEGARCGGGYCLSGRCVGGERDGKPCVSDWQDPLYDAGPGSPGFGTVWYTFVATDSSARVQTCGTYALDGDSLVQVFQASDRSTPEAACETLNVIGCSDDAPGCAGGLYSDVCVTGLVPGETYYVLLASKTEDDRGFHELEIESPCTPDVERPLNDHCQRAEPIDAGITPFDLAGATFHCPGDDCLGAALQNDLWYDWVAPCNGEAVVTTCAEGLPPDEQVNTILLVYEGCQCPVTSDDLLDCNLAAFGECGLSATARFDAVADECYKIRLGGHRGGEPAGELTIRCSPTCPEGLVEWIDPPDGVVDARQPQPIGDPSVLQGIDAFTVTAPAGAVPDCWKLCETDENPPLHPDYPPGLEDNDMSGVQDSGDGTYVVNLKRPITPGEITTITYTDDSGTEHIGRFIAHPADVNGDGLACAGDILAIVNMLNLAVAPPWGVYSEDIDHSGVAAANDILAVINLLNAGWSETARPTSTGDCP